MDSPTAQLRKTLAERRARLDRRVGQMEATAKRAKLAKTRAEEAENLAAACEEAARLMASFADSRQEKTLRAIEAVASAGLTSVFGEPVEIRLTQTVRARRPEIDITAKTGDLETSIMDARGGGLAQATGLLLKITTLLLTRDARRLIVADEPLAMLSAEYAPRMAEFLAELCEKLDLQLVLVTHDEALAEAADTAIQLSSEPSGTKAKILRRSA